MNKKTKLISTIGVVVLVVLIAVFALFHETLMPKGEKGNKTITVSIVYDETSKEVSINTDSDNLRGALEEEKLISGDESEYGLYVKVVDGRTADDSKQEWWSFTKGGEMLMTGVDDTPIADKEKFEITLKVGYDAF